MIELERAARLRDRIHLAVEDPACPRPSDFGAVHREVGA